MNRVIHSILVSIMAKIRFSSIQKPLLLSLSAICLLAMSCPGLAFADATTDYNVAIQFYTQKRWQLAADACESFVKDHPIHAQAPTIHLYWGQSLVHLREFKAARDKFRTYLEKTGESEDRPLAMYRVAECSYFLNDLDLASQELAAFLKKYTDHDLAERATVYLGEVQFRRDRFKEAIAWFEYYLKKYPNGSLKTDVEYSLARSLESDGQSAAAAEKFKAIAASETHPRAADAIFNQGARAFDSNDFLQASQNFVSLIDRFPNHRLVPVAALNAGFAFYQQRDFDKAIEQLTRAKTNPAQAANAAYWIGLCYKALGNYTLATQTFRDVLENTSDQALAESLRFQLGDSELRAGNLQRAIEEFTTVFETWSDGEYADDAVHSACEAAFRMDDLDQAIKLHQRFEKNYANGGLRMVQQLLYGRILIQRSDSLQDELETKQLLDRAVKTLDDVVRNSTIPQTTELATFQLARAYERLDRNDDVVRVLSEMLKNQSLAIDGAVQRDARLLLANANLRQEDFGQAMSAYQEIVDNAKSDDEKVDALAGLISAATVSKDWDVVENSLAMLQEIQGSQDQYNRLATAAGDLAFTAEDWTNAEKFFSLAARQRQDNPYLTSALSGQAHALFNQDRFVESAQRFKQLADAAGTDLEMTSRATYMQATALRKANELPAALAAFASGAQSFVGRGEITSQAKENLFLLLKNGARTARQLDQIEPANELYAQAVNVMKSRSVDQQSGLDRLIFEWADLNYTVENFERSDEIYKMLVNDLPGSSLADDASLILAESLRFGGNSEQARNAFEKLLADPSADEFVRRRSLVHLTDLAAEEGDWVTTLSAAKKLQSEFPDSEHRLYAEFRMAEALVQTKKFSEAMPILENLKNSFETDVNSAPEWWSEVWILYAASALENKEYGRLVEAVEQLRTLDPNSASLHRGDLLVGQSFERQARFDEAREAYERVIDSESGRGTPSAAEAQFRIAESFLKQENSDAAYRAYYKVYVGYDAPKYETLALNQAAGIDTKKQRWRAAVDTYRIVIKEFPESAEAVKAQEQVDLIVARLPELKSDQE